MEKRPSKGFEPKSYRFGAQLGPRWEAAHARTHPLLRPPHPSPVAPRMSSPLPARWAHGADLRTSSPPIRRLGPDFKRPASPRGTFQTPGPPHCHSPQVPLQHIADEGLIAQHFLPCGFQRPPFRGRRHDGLLRNVRGGQTTLITQFGLKHGTSAPPLNSRSGLVRLLPGVLPSAPPNSGTLPPRDTQTRPSP